MAPSITIRSPETYDELHAFEDVQRAAWDMAERDLVPAHLLVTFQRYGGITLGAFDGAQMVGFVFGYLGQVDAADPRAAWMDTPVMHCSEMMGILPAYRGRGIAHRLKLAQRDVALAQGHRLALWTFDPLVSRNAHLNIARLGGVCRRYIRNAYGELTGINAGLATDRLELEWWIAGERVARQVGEVGAPQTWRFDEALIANPTTPRADGLRAPAASPAEVVDAVGSAGPQVLVEVPGDVSAVKAADMKLAQAWQACVRAGLEAAFQAGYMVSGFASEGEGVARRSTYVLARGVDMAGIAGGARD